LKMIDIRPIQFFHSNIFARQAPPFRIGPTHQSI
jgi:hypothetical protein